MDLSKDTKHTNRLINEKSPYLLQHAHNPVDWYPWGEEAFEKAKREDKPIFLSIGYSTCHWCHVMERESFEDEEVANILNKNFVAIKVDREERPDIDSIYMTFCHTLTGHGGWPLSIFMTPDKKPFYAGTYFPKKSKYGHPGFIDILKKISHLWEKERHDLIKSSEEIVNAVKRHIRSDTVGELDKEVIHKAYRAFENLYDSTYGGFGFAPKFPTPHNLLFLLRYWKTTGNKKALEMVEKTLMSMYKGGIFDHIGFGFARYSTDEKWLVPHFEKMLYDNALLTIAYTEGYQATGKEIYKEIVEKILTYVIRDMTSSEGGFYSAMDADSEGEEGKFYVWTVEEVKKVLGEEGELFCKFYDITKNGNFEDKNIPNLIHTDIEEIEDNKELKNKLDHLREKLLQYREKRIHPFKDDKILTSWNGLMIVAMAYAGRVFRNESYISKSERAAKFILEKLVREDGRLLARYREGEAAIPGYLDDYAFLVWGLIELYESTFNIMYLKKAVEFNKSMLQLFWDDKGGGLFLYGNDSEQLIVKPKEVYDGAIPSGNSVAIMNMLKLSKITGDSGLEEMVQAMFKTFGKEVKSNPHGYSYFMMGLLYSNISSMEIIISGDKDTDDTRKMLDEVNKRFLPFATVVFNNGDKELIELIPFIKNQRMIDDNTTAYVCERFLCNEPTTEINMLTKLLNRQEKLN